MKYLYFLHFVFANPKCFLVIVDNRFLEENYNYPRYCYSYRFHYLDLDQLTQVKLGRPRQLQDRSHHRFNHYYLLTLPSSQLSVTLSSPLDCCSDYHRASHNQLLELVHRQEVFMSQTHSSL